MNNINLNTGYVNQTAGNLNSKPAAAEEKETKENAPAQVNTKDVSANDTLNFMSANAIYNQANLKLSPQALVNKYNSPEAIARISAMMGDFEAGVVAGLAKFEEEMGAAPAFKGLSEADKLALGAELYSSEAL